MDLLIDPGLALHLPLYELDGGSLKSKDAYGHLFTVTGALWRPDGRAFDGDDYIKRTVTDWQGADTEGTILVWFKTSDSGEQTLFNSCDEAATNRVFFLKIDPATGTLKVVQQNADTTDAVRAATTGVRDGVWHLGILASDGSAYFMWVDNIPQSLDTAGGSNTGDWLADTESRNNVVIGADIRSSPAKDEMVGKIGEVAYYNRFLTPQERQQFQLSTEWRYR